MANRVGEITEIMQNGRNGTLLSLGDKTAWINALENFLLTPESAQKIARYAGDNIKSRYNIDDTAESLIRLGKRYR